MLTSSRLPQSTCSGFTSTRRPSSAVAASSSSSPVISEPSHCSADATTPSTHLLIGCCCGTGKVKVSPSSTNSPPALNCCSSIHRDSRSSSSTSEAVPVSPPPVMLSTFRPTQHVDVTCHRRADVLPSSLLSSAACCADDHQRSTSSSFPSPPPPLSPSYVASLPVVSCVSCVSCVPHVESTSCLASAFQHASTVLVAHHAPCVDVPPPPPPPPPGVAPPCLIPPPPPLLPPSHRLGPAGASSSSSSSSQSSAEICGRTPRSKLRRLQWHKIPDSRVRAVGSTCVWAHVQRQFKLDSAAAASCVDLERVEQLFAVGSASSGGKLRPKSGPATTALDRRKSEQVELNRHCFMYCRFNFS